MSQPSPDPMVVTFSDLHTADGLKALEAHLAGKAYVSVDVISKDDVKVFKEVPSKPGAEFPGAARWYDAVSAALAARCTGKTAAVAGSSAAAAAAPAAEAAEECNEKVVANNDFVLDETLLRNVYSHVMPDCVSSSTNSGKKRTTSYGKDDSGTQHRSKRCSYSKSVEHYLAGLSDQRAAVQRTLEETTAVQEMVACPLNMEKCTKKLQRCGFSGELLWDAIDILKVDLKLRQIFLSLGDSDAEGYILRALGINDV